jgi:hypothetical protein
VTKTVQPKLFSKPEETSKLVLTLESSYFIPIQLPVVTACGASCFMGLNEDNFAVGFYDGHVYIRWSGNEYNYKLFTKPVLSIRPSKDNSRFWMCSLDGQVKCIETKLLTLMNRFYYKKGAEFIELFLYERGDDEFVSLLTLNGTEIILNKNL